MRPPHLLLIAALIAAPSLVACGGDEGGDGGSGGDGSSGKGGAGSGSDATTDASTGATTDATTDATTGGGSVSCDDVCAKITSCAGSAGECQTVCPQLPEACRSCIANTACEQIDAACAGPCGASSSSSSTGGGNCGAETTPCELDADCCSNNCSEGFCFDNSNGSFCELDADCASNNCYNGVCYGNEAGNPCELNADCASNNCTDEICF